jgi:hypothetical protein
MKVFVRNAVDCFDGVFHEFQAVRMGLDCRFWHATSTGCQHSKGDNYPVDKCGSVVIEARQFVFEYATKVCGQLRQHYWVGCFFRGIKPCCPSLRRFKDTAHLTNQEPHINFRNRLMSASNRWMMRSRMIFGLPGSYSIGMLTALHHLLSVRTLCTMTCRACVSHLRSILSLMMVL